MGSTTPSCNGIRIVRATEREVAGEKFLVVGLTKAKEYLIHIKLKFIPDALLCYIPLQNSQTVVDRL